MAIINVTGSGTTSGTAGADTINGSAGNDNIYGGSGDDLIFGNDGVDSVRGVDGQDTLYGGAGNDFIDGGTGVDTMYGGTGDDVFVVDAIGDTAIEYAGEGIDTVKTYIDWTLGNELEHLLLIGTGAINGTGNALDNDIKGNDAANILRGLAGDDSIDALGGNDVLAGGTGNDWARGGDGADTFLFDKAEIAATGASDVVADLDFSEGDRIELAGYGAGGAALTIANYHDLWLLADTDPTHVTVTQGTAPGATGDTIVTISDGANSQVIRLHDGSGTAPSWTQYLAACPDPMPGADSATTGENDTVTLDVLANDHLDIVTLKLSAATAPSGQGTASIVDGKLVFDPGHDFDSLAAGETATVTVDYVATSVAGKAGTGHATITIVGANDAAIIGGTDTGGVAEDGNAVASGILTVSDADHDQSSFRPATVAGSYGALQIAADGSWTYQLDNSAPGLATLNAGQSTTDVLTVQALDGTTHAVTITIAGADELATMADAVTIGENSATAIDVLANDSGSTALTLTGATAPAGKGSVAIVNGKLAYDPGTAFDYLQAGETATVTLGYTVRTAGGRMANEIVTVTVQGANDAATFGGLATGSVTEDGTLKASGALTVADKDHDQSSFQAGSVSSAYGTLTIGAGGAWSYQLNAKAAGLATLNDGQSIVDTLTVKSLDGTTKQIAITINGANEIPTHPDDYCGTGDRNDFDTSTTGTLYIKLSGSDLAKANIAYGTGSCDYIDARGGDDVIRAKGGEDIVFGGDGNDQLYGGSGLDWLDGGTGNDQLFGGSCSDLICGGAGADVIVGGFGADLLTGGSGADIFRFLDVRDTNDVIVDFTRGEDRLDLSHVLAGSSEHHFSAAINATKFSAGHDLIWYYDGCNTIVLGNTDGNPNTAEIEITLLGKIALGAGDFIL